MSTRPPVDDWATDFDHLDPRWIENPYPIWETLRVSTHTGSASARTVARNRSGKAIGVTTSTFTPSS